MNILILNGSPKGKNSITLQTMLYIRKMFPGHNYRVLHVGQKIRGFERDFSKAKTMLETADLIVFAYPVYTFIAPSQMHRFIELMKESGVRVAGKFVTQVTTSKHFYDVTAHRYIQDNCQDMKMKFIKGLSADMDDLLTKKGQKEAVNFFEYVLRCVEKDYYEPIPAAPRKYKPVEVSLVTEEDDAFVPDSEKTGDVVVVADLGEEDEQLSDMIARFRAVSKRKVRLGNLREYPFRGGCLGCFHCATDGECIYIDGFDKFLREKIQTAEAIVYAFTIRDHSMGALFKMYDDRQFCNGHRTVTMGMPMAYIISGDYRKEPNLQMIIEGRSEVGGNFLAGVATDEQIRIMLDVIKKYLVTDAGIKLCTPCDLGKLANGTASGSYFPGDRENGGVFKRLEVYFKKAVEICNHFVGAFAEYQNRFKRRKALLGGDGFYAADLLWRRVSDRTGAGAELEAVKPDLRRNRYLRRLCHCGNRANDRCRR